VTGPALGRATGRGSAIAGRGCATARRRRRPRPRRRVPGRAAGTAYRSRRSDPSPAAVGQNKPPVINGGRNSRPRKPPIVPSGTELGNPGIRGRSGMFGNPGMFGKPGAVGKPGGDGIALIGGVARMGPFGGGAGRRAPRPVGCGLGRIGGGTYAAASSTARRCSAAARSASACSTRRAIRLLSDPGPPHPPIAAINVETVNPTGSGTKTSGPVGIYLRLRRILAM